MFADHNQREDLAMSDDEGLPSSFVKFMTQHVGKRRGAVNRALKYVPANVLSEWKREGLIVHEPVSSLAYLVVPGVKVPDPLYLTKKGRRAFGFRL